MPLLRSIQQEVHADANEPHLTENCHACGSLSELYRGASKMDLGYLETKLGHDTAKQRFVIIYLAPGNVCQQ